MLYKWYSFLNLLIALPAFAAIARARYTVRAFRPFYVLLWIGLANELLSFALVYRYATNAVSGNIYVLLEYFLLLAQFYRWEQRRKGLYLACGVAGLVVWVSDNCLFNSLQDNNSTFRAVYALVIVLFSTDRVNRLAVLEKARLWTNASFILCTGFLLYYSTRAVAEVFNIFPLQLGAAFYRALWWFLAFVNVFANLIFTGGVLCIPRKEAFILYY